MSTERSSRPPSGNRGGRSGRRSPSSRRPRRDGYSKTPLKKQNPIVAFFKKIFGLDKSPKDSARSSDYKPREQSAPREQREPREPRAERTPRPPREEAPETPPEIVSTKLYIGNLSYETSESDLFDLFSKVGSVTNSEIIRDAHSKSKGFGFVEMDSLDKAKEAALKYHRTDFMSRQIVVAGAKK